MTEALKDRYRMVALDRFGYGGTTAWHGERPQTLADQADLVCELINRHLDSPLSATDAQMNTLEKRMSQKNAAAYTVLHLRFKLRVPPDALLAHSREAATIISSVEGLIWKIWVLQKAPFEMGGIYLFAHREAAEAYLNHPVIQAVRGNPAVVSAESQLWDVESSLSALTRAPLPDIYRQELTETR
jgi:hypothetical protein